MRHTGKQMSPAEIEHLLATGHCGHLATFSADGSPYVRPLRYVWLDGQVWLRNTVAQGHLQGKVRHEPRACFEVAVPGQVFAYGRFECDTSVEYQSVVAFGRMAIFDHRSRKARFFDALMAKYRGTDATRPQGFYPRLDGVAVYALSVARITGKAQILPSMEQQWPAADDTKSPEAEAPIRVAPR